jgi:hypothetical protein
MVTKRKSDAQLLLATHLGELGIEFVEEFQFHRTRRWLLDFFFKYGHPVKKSYAIEIEGGIYTQGRHTRGKGFQEDIWKYNEATAMGITLFRFSTQDVMQGRAKDFIREHIL